MFNWLQITIEFVIENHRTILGRIENILFFEKKANQVSAKSIFKSKTQKF